MNDFLHITEEYDTERRPIPPYIPPRWEFVVEKSRSGDRHVRQAGTDGGTSIRGAFVETMKLLAERRLFVFAKTILGMNRFTNHLHLDVCNYIQKCPPYRKLILLPRDCFKTTIVSKCLPLHMFIQQPETNPYFKGKLGAETKILLACETVDRGKKHITWIETHLEKNELLNAFWPEVSWEAPRRDARAWNATEFFLPRKLSAEQSDPSMQTVGVGGAVTGAHVDAIIDDDLVTFAAMNSPAIMYESAQWQTLSRSLLEDLDTGLEFIVGTLWAVNDIYSGIRKNDPTVDVYKRSLVEDGRIIFPEEFSENAVADLRTAYKHMFSLLYQNDPRDAQLCDFSEVDLRYYELVDNCFVFSEEPKDDTMEKRLSLPRLSEEEAPRELEPSYDAWDAQVFNRREYLERKR